MPNPRRKEGGTQGMKGLLELEVPAESVGTVAGAHSCFIEVRFQLGHAKYFLLLLLYFLWVQFNFQACCRKERLRPREERHTDRTEVR